MTLFLLRGAGGLQKNDHEFPFFWDVELVEWSLTDFREPLIAYKTQVEIELYLRSMGPMAQNHKKMGKNKRAAV